VRLACSTARYLVAVFSGQDVLHVYDLASLELVRRVSVGVRVTLLERVSEHVDVVMIGPDQFINIS
jgi:hypothetical protein